MENNLLLKNSNYMKVGEAGGGNHEKNRVGDPDSRAGMKF